MIRLALILCILSFSESLFSQDFLPDSVRQDFAIAEEDSIYIDRLNVLASQYLRANPNLTRTIANHVLTVSQRIKYSRGYARGLTVMGNSYWYEGIYEFAQNYYLLAAREYQLIDDSVGLGQTYNNIGEVYKKLKDNEKALQYLLRAADLKKRDTATHAITLYNIGELYIQLNKLDEAKKYLDISLKMAQTRNDKRVIAYGYLSFGLLERKAHDLEAALQYYFESEKIWNSMGEMRSIIQTDQEIAEVYREQGKYDEAEKYLLKAITTANQIKAADLQVKNYARYSSLDSLRGNYKRSLYFLSRHNSLKDSVYNLMKAEQIARLQTIYETETREQENKELRNERELKDAELSAQRITLLTITVGLIMAGILAWFLYRQRRKISIQKEAIEMQAVALLKLNEELQDLNKTLEIRIEERTAQLTIQNQRLTEYTFINAHKLRAPVASILGLINVMQQVKPEEKENILEHLKTCGEQLDSIIREVSRNLEDAIVQDKP